MKKNYYLLKNFEKKLQQYTYTYVETINIDLFHM